MADETDYGFGGYDLGGYSMDDFGYDWEEWFDPSQWGVDTPYGSINENVDPSKTVVNKDGTTYFYDKNNNFLGGVGSSGQVITNTPGNQFASVLRNLFGGTGDLGALGQLGAFAGLAGLANQSNFFNPPAQKVGFQGVIPKYEYERQQTPMSVQRPEGYRPGQGGVTYFTPGQYYDVGYDPATAGEFLNTDTTLPSAPETTESQLARGGLAYADGGFTNEQIYNTYQNLLGQGMSHEQILAAAARNPNLNLNAGQINTALAQFQAPKFTDQQFLEAGRTALQQGLDPQTALQKAAEFGASQDQLNRLTGALGSSGIAGLVTPTTTLAYNPPANIPAPPSDYTNAYTQYENQQNANRAREVIDSGMSTFANKTNITTQDILETGRSLLQQGVNPQDVLNQLAKNPSVTQATLNSAAAALGASGYKGITTPMTKFTSQASGAITGGASGAVTGGGGADTGGIATLQTGDKKTTMPVQTRAEADAGIVKRAPQTYGDQMVPGTNMTVRDAYAILAKREPNVYRVDNPVLNRPINYFSKRAEGAAALDPAAAEYLKTDAAMQDYADRGLVDPEGIAWLLRKPADLNAPGALVAWQRSRPGYAATDPANYKTFEEFEAAQKAGVPSWSGSLGDPYSALSRIQRYYGFESPNAALQSVGVTPFADPAEQAKAIADQRAQLKQYGSQYLDRFEKAVSAWQKMTAAIDKDPLLADYGPAISGSALLINKVAPTEQSRVPVISTTPTKSTLPVSPVVRPTSITPTTTPTTTSAAIGRVPTTPAPTGGISTIPTQYTQALMTALARAAAARRATPTTASRTTAKQAGIGSLTPTTVLRRKPVGGAAGGDVTMLAKGRYLKGDGDGVSDSIDAKFVGSGQPAALADGEFVIPARVVSELGNGSSDAGARKLYAMLDRVEQRARKAKRGKPSGADRELKKLA